MIIPLMIAYLQLNRHAKLDTLGSSRRHLALLVLHTSNGKAFDHSSKIFEF